MANHAAKREDGRVIDDLRLFHYGHLDFTRRDALADAIQAAREQGIPSYLMVRSALNLTIFETFEQMAGNVWPALDTVSRN